MGGEKNEKMIVEYLWEGINLALMPNLMYINHNILEVGGGWSDKEHNEQNKNTKGYTSIKITKKQEQGWGCLEQDHKETSTRLALS